VLPIIEEEGLLTHMCPPSPQICSGSHSAIHQALVATMFAPLLRSLKPRAAAAAVRNVHIERKLEELGYVLPAVAEPKGNYRTCVRSGNYIFTGKERAGCLLVSGDWATC
jgi:hypothetical protein